MSKVSWLASTCSASALVFAAGLASPGWAQPQSNVQVAEASRLQEVIVTVSKRHLCSTLTSAYLEKRPV